LWEGFPNVILEAGANGLPVVATDTYGTVDVIKGGKGGFLVNKEYLGDMEEKIIDLVKNDKLRYDMGLELHNIVRENYTMEKNLTKLIDIMK
jgi:glycosyltransferase involved in cell wall biosynthesis